MTATAKNINRLQGRSPAFSNGVGKSLRRTGAAFGVEIIIESIGVTLHPSNTPVKIKLIIGKTDDYFTEDKEPDKIE